MARRTFNGLERNKVQIVGRALSWSEERLKAWRIWPRLYTTLYRSNDHLTAWRKKHQVRISSQEWRSLSCQNDLGWSEFQVKTEEVPVVWISSQDWRSLSRLFDLGCSEVQMRMKKEKSLQSNQLLVYNWLVHSVQCKNQPSQSIKLFKTIM